LKRYVCPTDTIAAPVERVWQLMTDPDLYDTWIDGRVERASPRGPAQPGQVVDVSTRGLGRRWTVKFRVLAVDPQRHVFELDVDLPLGLKMHERMTAVPLDAGHTRLSFG
jgi:hypothetical protein